MHLSTAIRKVVMANQKRADLLSVAEDAFMDCNDAFGLSWSCLAGKIKERLTIGDKPPSKRTIERRIESMVSERVIKKMAEGTYVFTP